MGEGEKCVCMCMFMWVLTRTGGRVILAIIFVQIIRGKRSGL